MKYFVVGFVFAIWYCVSAITEEQKQLSNEIAKQCASDTGLTEEQGQTIRDDPGSNLNDVNAQKLIKCILEKWRFIDDKGDFLEKVAVEVLSNGEDRAKYEEIAKECRSATGGNKDEMPIHVYTCYIKYLKE